MQVVCHKKILLGYELPRHECKVITVPVYKTKVLFCERCGVNRLYTLTNRFPGQWEWEFAWEENLTKHPLTGNELESWKNAIGMVQPRPWFGIKFSELDPFKSLKNILKEPKYTDHYCHETMKIKVN